MLIIGELINSTRKEVRAAIENQDADFIKDLALKQVEAGADYLDVNAGAFVDEEIDYLMWLIDTVRSVTDVPLAIDSADPVAITKALEKLEGQAMVNSITAEKAKMDALIPVIKQYNAKVIALCMDDSGMPDTAEQRLRIVDKFCEEFTKAGIDLDNVYLDPLVKPISVNSNFGNEVLTTLEEINKRYKGVHTTCGLSNVSYGLPERKVLNQAFFVMCVSRGMDAVIIDPLDKRIMSLLYAAEALIGRDKHCVKYLQAARKGIVKAS